MYGVTLATAEWQRWSGTAWVAAAGDPCAAQPPPPPSPAIYVIDATTVFAFDQPVPPADDPEFGLPDRYEMCSDGLCVDITNAVIVDQTNATLWLYRTAPVLAMFTVGDHTVVLRSWLGQNSVTSPTIIARVLKPLKKPKPPTNPRFVP